jgi:ribosomal protein S17
MSKETTVIKKSGVVRRVDGRTARVLIADTKLHPIYKKRYTVHSQVLADVPAGRELQIGDEVTVSPCRRVSKTKYWQVK